MKKIKLFSPLFTNKIALFLYVIISSLLAPPSYAAVGNIYVANYGGNSVSVIDRSTNTIVKTIAVGWYPYGIGANRATNKVYVANSGQTSVSVINGATNAVAGSIFMTRPWAIDVNDQTNRVYVTNISNNTLTVVNGLTDTVITTIPLVSAFSVSVNASTNKIYVGNANPSGMGNSVTVIDGATNAVIKTIGVGSGPRAVRVNPATNKIYVGNFSSGSISVIDGSTDTVVKTITGLSGPAFIGVNKLTNRIYVPNFATGKVSVIDGSTDIIIATIPVGVYPNSAAVDPDTNTIYVVNYGANSISAINGATNSITKTILTSGAPIYAESMHSSGDTTPPETTITANPPLFSSSNSATFEFSSNEADGTFVCQLDGAGFTGCASPKSYSGLADGSHMFNVRATDPAGNTDATPASFTWIVDTVAPISTVNVTPAMPNGENDWYNTDVSYAITATDSGGSGIAETLGCADTTNNCVPAVGGASGTLTAEGNSYIRFQSRDNAGNLESVKVQLVKIDKTKPAVALNSLLVFDGDGFVNLVWSATDGVSGVSEAQIYRNGTLIHTSLNPSGSFVDDRSLVANDGQTFAYTARAKDYAGQLNDSAAQSTTVDLSPPSVPGIVSLPAFTKALSVLVHWYRAVDATAGVDYYNVYRNGQSPAYAIVDELDPNGTDTSARRSLTDVAVSNGLTFTYRVSGVDLAVPAHESAQSDPAITTVDTTAPVTTKTLDPAAPNGENGWFVTPFGVTLDCADATSGCNDTKYSLNNGVFVVYTGTFLIETDGAYLIKYFSTDNAGNFEAEKSQTEKLDQTKPVIANNPAPSVTNNSNLTVSGTVTDAASGVAGFAINGTPVTLGAGGSYSHTVTLSEGVNTITEVAKDVAGNMQTVVKQVTLDTAAPVAIITSGPSSPTTETLATFTFTANEAATFECQLDGGAFSVCASPKTYTGLAEGAHTVLARARDAAGNLGAPASFSWTIVLSPDSDGDGIFNEIDTLPSTFSGNFDDRPLGGTTFGVISSRGGLTLAIEKPAASNVVRVSASGVGTTAVVNACAENFRVLVTSGDVTDIVCGASITAEALVTPDDVTVRSSEKSGRFGRLRLQQGERGTMADPPLEITMTAAGTNAARVEFDVADEATGNVLATGTLDPSESVKVDFSDSVAVSYAAVAGTVEMVADGTPLLLSAGQSFTDQCLGVAGNLASTGCPVGDKNIVTLHNVYLGGGTTSKAPLADARVRVFDRNNPNFQTVAGSKNPDGSLYGVIYEADAGRVGACTTGSDGICIAGERVTGDLLVIVKFADAATGKTVYVGRPKSPTDFVDSNGDGVGDLATKELQIMKVFRKGVFEGYRGGDKTIVTGSMLEMIVPASGVWEGVRSLYPFVFNSDSDWAVDVCAQVPQGYSLVGAYDENGDLVASTQCVQTTVANQTKVIAFEVKEVASPEPSFVGTLKVTHKGKVTPVEVRVSDIRRASFDMKLKEARAKVGVSKVPVSRMERGDKTARLIKVGASLWSIVRDVFGLEGRDAEIVTLGKKIARLNAIRVPEWGIMEGRYDAEALPWGFALTLGGVEELRLAP